MKKIITVFFTIFLVVLFAFSAFAHNHSGNVAELDIKYEYNETNNLITVDAYIVNISDPTGITEVEYDVVYNKSNLKLKEFKAHMPAAWEQYVENEYAEDLSKLKREGLFRWAIMVFEEAAAIKNDNELRLTLVFEVKQKKATKIDYEFVYMANGPLDVVSGNSSTINIVFEDDKPQIDISDTEPSVPDIPSKEDLVPSVSDEISESDDESLSISGDSIEIEDDGDLPQLFAPNNSAISDITFDSSDISESDDDQSSIETVLIVIVIIIIFITVSVVVLVLLLHNKRKVK